MSRYHDLEADLQLLNLEFAESDFAKFQGPIFDERWMWNLNPDWMNNAFGNQELNHAIQLSEYLQQQSNYRIEDVSPQPACLYEPAPIPNFVDIPGPVGAEFDVESTLFRPDGEMHSKINSAHLNLLDEVGTALPTACGSHMVNIQEPMKRGRGRPKGSKTKQHVSSLASKCLTPTKLVDTDFS